MRTRGARSQPGRSGSTVPSRRRCARTGTRVVRRPLGQAASTQAESRYQEAVAKYQTANRDALDVYRQLSALAPEDSSALIRWGQAAEGAGDVAAALKVYKTFVKRFPTDPLVVDARQKIKDLQQQIAQQAASPQG